MLQRWNAINMGGDRPTWQLLVLTWLVIVVVGLTALFVLDPFSHPSSDVILSPLL